MKKAEKEKQEKENKAYMENYKQLVQRLTFLSRFNCRQFLGTRPEGDPRVDYLAGLEGFKHLVDAQLSGIIRVLTMMLGDKKQEFLKIMEEELGNELKSMEEELGVTGWTAEGQPQFDLQILRDKTKGWPA
ncbi:hypothetical protein ES703_103238 [subsurface metagenome]